MIKRILFFSLMTIMATRTEAQEQNLCALRSLTIAHFLPAHFKEAETTNLVPADDAAFKTVPGSSAPVTATLVSPELRTAFPFNQLLASANALLGPDDSIELSVQVKLNSGWSRWFEFGTFKPSGGSASVKDQQDTLCRMDIDTLNLKERSEYIRYRIKLTSAQGSAAKLKLVSLVYTDTDLPYNETFATSANPKNQPVKLDVPKYSQILQQVNFSKDICSPTSVAMVMNYFGENISPLDAAAAVVDEADSIYGNWTFNTLYAGSKKHYAFLTRLNSIEEAQAYLAAGIPLVISVTFGPGEVKKAPIKKTTGHLIVIKGFDSKGNIIVNDPAAPYEKTVERSYSKKELAAAWLRNKYGTAYVITPDMNTFLTAAPPYAEMFSAPVDPEKDERAKLIETQVLANEPLQLLEAGTSWLKVEAPEQKHKYSRADKYLKPYGGWIEAEKAIFSAPRKLNAVIKSKTVDGLSIGTKVTVMGRQDKTSVKALVNPQLSAVLKNSDINFIPIALKPEEIRRKIVETARLFLGDQYYWGGRSSEAIDCSGLIGVSYRAWGMDLPRNAADQFEISTPVSTSTLKPADLVFSTEKGGNSGIDHVMLYAGGGKFIEATKDTCSVREVTFKEKFGAELAKAKSSQTINGKKIYFRTVINAVNRRS